MSGEASELSALGQSAVRWRDRITAAQQGDREAMGEIFQRLRAYLRARAVEQLDEQLQVKVSPSDVVQETLLEAHRGFATFRGGTQAELVVWVQGILNHRVQTAYRKYRGTSKRNIGRETGLHELSGRNNCTSWPRPKALPAAKRWRTRNTCGWKRRCGSFRPGTSR